ncbi:hypothetical protein H1D32_08495 [Anaerobacillus sp. CMMVII]|uniref:hypothetical protein n=1 Tax=Anaerobacillus sp. CMMVII TaxID=2755588 RepID=UPI0021B6EAD2|nr:hypothetical protein [Anaerobacillus sp. CMMVII]MCT8137791.1 hypothetical protein [Anaerobacillus sp. CMMVII]
MKRQRLCFLLLFCLLVVGCSANGQQQLSRVDVQMVNLEGSEAEIVTITDKTKLGDIKLLLKRVNWEPNSEVSMERREDAKITLYLQLEQDMPEQLFEYRVWFNEDDTITIISNNLKEGYGYLDQKNTEIFKREFLKVN